MSDLRHTLATVADTAALVELARHNRAVCEEFRVRLIRSLGTIRIIPDDTGLTDLVELDAVLDALRAVPVTAS